MTNRVRPLPLALLLLALAFLIGGVLPGSTRAQEGEVAPPARQDDPPAPTGEGAAGAPAGGFSLAALKKAGGDVGSTWGQRAQSAFGMLVLLAACFLLSNNRGAISWRLVGWGIGLQLALGVLIMVPVPGLGRPLLRPLFEWVNQMFVSLMGFTGEGAAFLFGNLARGSHVPAITPAPGEYPPHAMQFTPTGDWVHVGSFFAFGVLPTIIFFSSLMAVLYHLGVMQWVVKGIAWVMQRTMGTSGSETLAASGNIFVGQTEAPLLVRPFVQGMTESELMAIMTAGFATVAGGVMAAYVGMLQATFADIAGHLLAASVMSAPAALVCAKLMIPEPDPSKSETYGELKVELEKVDVNVIEAASRGAADGLKLALNVGAMLLAFIALIALLNGIVGWAGAKVGFAGVTIQGMLGVLLAPLAWIMGVPWDDASAVGQLIGTKTVANEFVAYMDLSKMLRDGVLQHPRSVVITTYALCGFANFSSIAIQIGGIGGIAPERKGDLARLGLRAMIAGTVACFLTATVAGMLI